jgi:glucose 1-dehydrogenase
MSYQPLLGQKALVTGSSSGIGAGVALELARAGADVVVNYSSSLSGAQKVVDEITALGRQTYPVQGDVSKEEDVNRMFDEMLEKWGTIDILVNNAGLQQDAPFVDMTLAQWNKVIGINLTGMFLCAQRAVKEFIRRGTPPEGTRALGKIINMSSVHEIIPWAGHANYASSKGGVRMFTQTLSQELAPQGIRINAIGPGAIATPINRPAWETPEALQSLLKLIPYKRVGQAIDIGKAAVWLASDDSDYVNGQTLFVDGGMTLFPEFADGG